MTDLVKTVTNSLLDQLALIHQNAIEAMPNASLRLPFEQESQRGLGGCPSEHRISTATPAMSDKCSATQARIVPDRANRRGRRRSSNRGFALLNAAAVKGRVNVCPRGAPPFVIEVPDANVSRSRSYRGTLKVEGHVDGLRWHNLAFSVHGAPLA